jgi:hypothetical protein
MTGNDKEHVTHTHGHQNHLSADGDTQGHENMLIRMPYLLHRTSPPTYSNHSDALQLMHDAKTTVVTMPLPRPSLQCMTHTPCTSIPILPGGIPVRQLGLGLARVVEMHE